MDKMTNDELDAVIKTLGEEERENLRFAIQIIVRSYQKDSDSSSVILHSEDGRVTVVGIGAGLIDTVGLISAVHASMTEQMEKAVMADAPPRELFN
jgi:hypothetical protein